MKEKWIDQLLSFISFNNRFERIWKIAQVDFKRRYYNDKLGLAWALLNPLFTVSIYYYVFTKILNRVSEGINNYAIFLFSGIIFWMAFVEMMRKGMATLLQKRYIIQNIKVNKEDLYISTSISITFALFFNIIAYLFMVILFGGNISMKIFFLPLLIANVFLLGTGIGMLLSIIYLYMRDLSHLIDILIMLGFWTSGIFFKAELIKEKAILLYYLNPFIGIIDNVRKITLYNEHPNLITMNINIVVGIFVYIVGFRVMKKNSNSAMERL